jgi:hypothetical protein
MKRRFALSPLAALALPLGLPVLAAPQLPEVHVFKSPYCGCCGAWVDHLKSADFAVKVTDVDDTTAARKRLGMPDGFGNCHTATVGDYVLEGHVPAKEVRRMLAEKPMAVGLAVPGMPPGSPGMEVGARKDPYDVFLIAKGGQPVVYAHYPK